MFKHTRLFVPAVLAAGAMLLTACDQGGSDDAAQQNTPTSTSSSAATGASGEDTAAPADATEGAPTSGGGSTDGVENCGTTAVNNGVVLVLVPDEAKGGYATCDEVRAVWDEFTGIAEQGATPTEGVTVDGDWQCVPTVKNGDIIGVDCFTPAVPDANNPVELKFHAEPQR
jgi:hypothetical protein